MNIWQTFKVAFLALARSKTRSFLTMLGIIIGVAATISMLAIGEGAKAKVESTFSVMGANLLVIMSGSTNKGGSFGGFGTMPTLTWDDLRAIREETVNVSVAAALLRTTTQAISETENWTTSVSGTSPEYFVIREWGLAAGEMFTDLDVTSSAKVVVIGKTIQEKLFGLNVDPLGQIIRLNKNPFQVVGVLASKGQAPMGQDYDDAIFMPATTFESKIQGGRQNYIVGSIFVRALNKEATSKAERELNNLLMDRHHIDKEENADFSVRNLTEIASAMESSSQTMATLLAGIAMVSLVVGGIGIMNIMLVSVTERTREIGIRLAVGAKPRNILAQFLVESLALSGLGGVLGVLLGVGLATRLAKQFSWPLVLRLDIIFLAVTISMVVGVIFGLYPAYKASKLNPIEALRYE